MHGLKATAIDPTQIRSQRLVVKKILELDLVSNVEQLGIKPRKPKDTKPGSESDSGGVRPIMNNGVDN